MPHLLIVGPQAAPCRDIQALCHAAGWITRAVPDLPALVAALRARPPDLLIVVAIGTEGHDLLSTLTTARCIVRLAPVVVVVRGQDLDTRRHAFVGGAADVIGWPAPPHEAQVRLAALLRRARSAGRPAS